ASALIFASVSAARVLLAIILDPIRLVFSVMASCRTAGQNVKACMLGPLAHREDCMRHSVRLALTMVLGLLAAGCGGAQAPAPSTTSAGGSSSAPSTGAEVGRYQAADRQHVLEAGARKEGSVTWYTVM